MSELRIHPWNSCNACGAAPIVGKRYECQVCPLGPDVDLCEACHGKVQQGQLEHPSPDNMYAAHLKNVPHHFICFEGSSADSMKVLLDVPMADAPLPRITDGFVLRPEFLSGYESTFAGYSFVIQFPGFPCPLLLTAYHVMDEMLRKKGVDATPSNEAYTGRELPAHITGVNLYNVFAQNWMLASMGRAGSMLVLRHARIREEEPNATKDIAAFRIPDPLGLAPGRLAEKMPEIGEPVFLAASEGRGATQRAFKAVVVDVTEQSFVFRFEHPKVPSYTSGAPILNERAEVVAINVGGGVFEGQRFGHGNHLSSIRKHLEEAL